VDFLKDITYQITGVGIRNITLNEVTLDISAKIYNASNVEATVKEMYLDILLNGIKVGSVNEVKDITILPTQTSIVQFSFTFNPRVIAGNIVNIVSLTTLLKDVIFTAKGYVKGAGKITSISKVMNALVGKKMEKEAGIKVGSTYVL
jgi:hypothetical protein